MTDYIIMFTVRDADSYPSDFDMYEIADAVAPILGVDASDITDLDWEESE